MSLARFEVNSDVWLGELVHSDEWSGRGWAFAVLEWHERIRNRSEAGRCRRSEQGRLFLRGLTTL